jgi:hypothetical protein
MGDPKSQPNPAQDDSQFAKPWILVVGCVCLASTLVFIMFLIILSTQGQPIPREDRYLFYTLIALSLALSFAFLGGYANAKGSIPFPLGNIEPLKFSLGGGVAAFIIVLALFSLLFPVNVPPGSQPDTPPVAVTPDNTAMPSLPTGATTSTPTTQPIIETPGRELWTFNKRIPTFNEQFTLTLMSIEIEPNNLMRWNFDLWNQTAHANTFAVRGTSYVQDDLGNKYALMAELTAVLQVGDDMRP